MEAECIQTQVAAVRYIEASLMEKMTYFLSDM